MTNLILTAGDVAAAIGETLAGNMTKEQLGYWAHQALLDDDAGSRTIGDQSSIAICDALHQLMFNAEGPEWEMDDAELRAMMELLDHPDAHSNSLYKRAR